MNIPEAAQESLSETKPPSPPSEGAVSKPETLQVRLGNLLPRKQADGGNSAVSLPRLTQNRLDSLQADLHSGPSALAEIDLSTDEGVQQAFNAYYETPLGQRSRREQKTKQLRGDLGLAEAGQLLTPEEYAEKTAVGINLKAKSGLESLSNTLWRTIEIGATQFNDPRLFPMNPGLAKMADEIMKVANTTANFAAEQKDIANQEFENIQPDTGQRIAGAVAEQVVQNAPSMITMYPATKIAGVVTGGVKALNEARRAEKFAQVGFKALTDLEKLNDYKKLATATMLGVSAGASGWLEGVPEYDEVYRKLIKEGYAETDAKTMAGIQGAAVGMTASILTAAFGTGSHGGIESVYNMAKREGLRQQFFNVAKQTLGEGSEEGLHAAWSGFLDKAMANPNRSMESIMQETMQNFIAGSLFGGGVATVGSAYQELVERPAAERMQAEYSSRAKQRGGDAQIHFGGTEVHPMDEAAARAFRDPGEDAELLRPLSQREYFTYREAVLNAMAPGQRADIEERLKAEADKGQRGPATRWMANRMRIIAATEQGYESENAQRRNEQLQRPLDLYGEQPIPRVKTSEGTVVGQTDEQIYEMAKADVRRYIPEDELADIDNVIAQRSAGASLDAPMQQRLSEYEGRISNWIGSYKYQEQQLLNQMDIDSVDRADNTVAAVQAVTAQMSPNFTYTYASDMMAARNANQEGVYRLFQLRDKYQKMQSALSSQPDFDQWMSVPENMAQWEAVGMKAQYYGEALDKAIALRERARLQGTERMPEVDEGTLSAAGQANIDSLYKQAVAGKGDQEIREMAAAVLQGESPQEMSTRFGITPEQARAVRVTTGVPGYDQPRQFNEWLYKVQQAGVTADVPLKPLPKVKFNGWSTMYDPPQSMWTVLEDVPDGKGGRVWLAGGDYGFPEFARKGYESPVEPPRPTQPGAPTGEKKGRGRPKGTGAVAAQELTNDHKIKALEWILTPGRKGITAENLGEALSFPDNTSSKQPLRNLMSWLQGEIGLQKDAKRGRFGKWTFSEARAQEALIALKGGGVNPVPTSPAIMLAELTKRRMQLVRDVVQKQLLAAQTNGEERTRLLAEIEGIGAEIESLKQRIDALIAAGAKPEQPKAKTVQPTTETLPVVTVDLKGLRKNTPTSVSVGEQKFQIRWTSKRVTKDGKPAGFESFYELKQEDGKWTQIGKNREEAIEALKSLVAVPPQPDTGVTITPDEEGNQPRDPTRVADDKTTMEDIRRQAAEILKEVGKVRTLISIGLIGAAVVDFVTGNIDAGMAKAASAGVDPHTAKVLGMVIKATADMVRYGFRRFVDVANNLVAYVGPEIRPYIVQAYQSVRDLAGLSSEMDDDSDIYRAIGGSELAMNPSESPGSYVDQPAGKRRMALKSRSRTGRFAMPMIQSAVAPTEDMPSEAGYVYHVTNDEAALDIAESHALKPFWPYGKAEGRRVWQDDASSEPRSYWTNSASLLAQHIPPVGKPVVMRVKLRLPTEQPKLRKPSEESRADFEISNHGDIFTRKAIPTDRIEILTKSGWKKMWTGEYPSGTREGSLKEPAKMWPTPNRTPGLGSWGTDTVDVGMTKLGPKKTVSKRSVDAGAGFSEGGGPVPVVITRRRRSTHQGGYDPIVRVITEAGTQFSFDSKGNLQQNYRELPDEALEMYLTIMRSRATPDLKFEDWIKMSPTAMKKWAIEHSYGNPHDLAIAIGRNVVKDDGLLHVLVTQYRKDRLVMFDNSNIDNPNARKRFEEAEERLMIWSSAIQAATASGSVGEQVLIHDPTWLPGIKAQFDWINFLREDKEAVSQLINAKGPSESVIFLTEPTVPLFLYLLPKHQQPKVQGVGGTFKAGEEQVAPSEEKRIEHTTMDTVKIDYTIAHSGNLNELKKNLPANLKPYEQAYADKLWSIVSARPDRIITNADRQQALEAAKAAGYKEGTERALGVDPTRAREQYPRLINAPLASPVGDRLYRKTHTMKNGYRTVAVETFRLASDQPGLTQEQKALAMAQQKPSEEEFNVSELWPALQTMLKVITPAAAKNQDHIIATVNGKYVGFYGWKDTVTDAKKTAYYALINEFPASEEYSIPVVKYRPRIIKRGGLGPRDSYFNFEVPESDADFMHAYDLPGISDGQVYSMFYYIDELEAQPEAQQLFKDFLWDTWGGGTADSTWLNPRQVKPSELPPLPGKGPIVHEVNESKFARSMLKQMHKAVFSDVKQQQIGDKVQQYVTVQIPGTTGQIAVFIDSKMTKEAIYNAFVQELIDAMTVRLAQVVVWEQMGLPLQKTNLDTFKRVTMENYVPQVGDKVLIRHHGEWVQGFIKKAYNQPIFEYDTKVLEFQGPLIPPPVVETRATGIKGERMVYDVEVPSVTEEVTPQRSRKLYVTAMTPSEIRKFSEEAPVTKQQVRATVSYGVKKGARPNMFDGQPLAERKFMGRDMRSLYMETAIPVNREALKIWWGNKFSDSELLSFLVALGGDVIPYEDEFTREAKGEAKSLASRFTPERQKEILEKGKDTWLTANRSHLMKLTPAERQAKALEYEASHKRRERGLLIDRIIEEFRHIYTPLIALYGSNMRAKAYAAKTLLTLVPKGTAIPSQLRPLYKKVKSAQIGYDPRVQNARLARKNLEDRFFPPRERTGGMIIRLAYMEEVYSTEGMPQDDESRDALMRMPLGKIVVNATKLGSFYASGDTLQTDKKGELIGVKELIPTPVDAFMTVSKKKNRVNIQVVDLSVDGGYRTVYWVDLDLLKKQGGAKEWDHRIDLGTEEVNGQIVQKYSTLHGWYLNPGAVANSARGMGGESLWTAADHTLKKWLSVEDYFEYLGQIMRDPRFVQFSEMVDEDGTPAVVPSTAQLPTGLSELMEDLEAKVAAGNIQAAELITLMNTTPISDTAFWGWRDTPGQVMTLLSNLYIPGWEKMKPEDYAEKFDDLESGVQAFMEYKVRDGLVASISTTPPTIADVDPALVDKEFTGRRGITEFFNAPMNGIAPEQVRAAMALLRFLPDVIVNSFGIKMVLGPSIGGRGERVFYTGTFSHVLRLARIIANSGDVNAIAEEIAHAAARFLPEVMAQEVERLRKKELDQMNDKEKLSNSAKDFLAWIAVRNGQVTSQEFMAANRPDWAGFYHLINTDEYFAHHLTDAAMKAEKFAEMGKIRQFFYGFINKIVDAVKSLTKEFGYTRDTFFDGLLERFTAGDFNISMNGGFLAEINSHSDIGSVFVVRNSAQFIKKTQEGDWRGLPEFDQQNPTTAATIASGSFSTILNISQRLMDQFKAAGNELTGTAKGLTMVTNVENLMSLTRDLAPTLNPTTYDLAKITLPTEALREQLKLCASAVLHDIERQYSSVVAKWNRQSEYMASPAFKSKLEGINKRSAKIYTFEAMVESVETQIISAIKALQLVATERGASQEKYNRAQEDLRWLNRVRNYVAGVTQRMEQITAALAATPGGFELLESGVAVDPLTIEKAWLATDPPAESIPQEANIDRDPAWAMQRVAFIMLAKYIRLRGHFAAASYSKEEAVLGALPAFAASLTEKLAKEKNATAITRMVRMNGRNFSNLEKAKRILLELQRDVEHEANKMASYDQAKDFMEAMLRDPEYILLSKQVRADVGEKYTPRIWAEFGNPELSEEIALPFPIPGMSSGEWMRNKMLVTIPNDNSEWDVNMVRIRKSAEAIQAYMAGLPDESMEFGYLQTWLDFIDGLLYSSQLNQPGMNEFFGFKWIVSLAGRLTQHIESIFTAFPSRITNMLKAPLRAWSDSSAMMNGKWKPNYIPKLSSGANASVRSHPELDLGRGKANITLKMWRDAYGRELGCFLSQGMRFEPGSAMPVTGNRITQEDLDFFALQTKAIDEAMSYNVKRDRDWIPEPLRKDQWVPGYEYMRRNIKTQPGLLVRKWNHEALEFTSYYVRLIKQGRVAEAAQYLDANMMGPVLWFLAHRQAGWMSNSFTNEAAYADAAEALKAGRVKNMAELLAFLDSNFGLTSDVPDMSLSKMFMEEFNNRQNIIYNTAIGDEKRSDMGRFLKATATENAFTLGATEAIAPGWWYNWGIVDNTDAMNFALSGSSQYVNEFKRMLMVTIETLKRNQAQITAAASFMVNAETQAGRPITTAQAQLKMKSGARSFTIGGKVHEGQLAPQEIGDLIRQLQRLYTDVEETYEPGKKFVTHELRMVMRIAGTLVSGILASVPNTMVNLTYGAFGYNAFFQKIVGQSAYKVVPTLMVKTVLRVAYGIGIFGPAFIYNLAAKTHKVSAAKNLADLLLGPFGRKVQGKWRPLESWLKFEADIAPALLATVDAMSWKRGTDEHLRSLGLGMEVDMRALLYPVAENISQGGILNLEDTERSLHPWRQAARTIFGLIEYHTLGLSKLAPRWGDLTANISLFNTSQGAVENIERQLRKTWAARRSAMETGLIGTTAGRTFTAAEVVPGFFRSATGRQTVHNNISNWFNSSGIDLNQSIYEFFTTLDNTPEESRKKVRWLSEPQMFALSQEVVEAVNVGSPKNRPTLASKDTLHRLVLLLNGWNINMALKQIDWLGAHRGQGNFIGRFGTKSALLAVAAVIFALNAMQLEELLRPLMWLFGNEARTSRQPWEAESAAGVAKEVFIDIAAAVPGMSHLTQATIDSTGGRMGQGLTIPVQNWVTQGINYVSGVINTGDPSYGLDRLVRSWLPSSRIVLNRLPALSGSVEAFNSRRLLARYGDDDLLREQRAAPSLTGRTATRLTPYADRMVNAAMHEDWEELNEQFNEAVVVAMEDGDVSREEAVKRVRQMYSSRNAYQRAFKQFPTELQRLQTLNKMPLRERSMIEDYERKFQAGGRRIGANIRYTAEESPGLIRYDRGGLRSLARIRASRMGIRRSLMRGRNRNPLTSSIRRL